MLVAIGDIEGAMMTGWLRLATSRATRVLGFWCYKLTMLTYTLTGRMLARAENEPRDGASTLLHARNARKQARRLDARK